MIHQSNDHPATRASSDFLLLQHYLQKVQRYFFYCPKIWCYHGHWLFERRVHWNPSFGNLYGLHSQRGGCYGSQDQGFHFFRSLRISSFRAKNRRRCRRCRRRQLPQTRWKRFGWLRSFLSQKRASRMIYLNENPDFSSTEFFLWTVNGIIINIRVIRATRNSVISEFLPSQMNSIMS